jgi:hypothetical protein
MVIIGHAAQYSSTNLSFQHFLLVLYILSVITINIFNAAEFLFGVGFIFCVLVFLNRETDWAWLEESPESAI